MLSCFNQYVLKSNDGKAVVKVVAKLAGPVLTIISTAVPAVKIALLVLAKPIANAAAKVAAAVTSWIPIPIIKIAASVFVAAVVSHALVSGVQNLLTPPQTVLVPSQVQKTKEVTNADGTTSQTSKVYGDEYGVKDPSKLTDFQQQCKDIYNTTADAEKGLNTMQKFAENLRDSSGLTGDALKDFVTKGMVKEFGNNAMEAWDYLGNGEAAQNALATVAKGPGAMFNTVTTSVPTPSTFVNYNETIFTPTLVAPTNDIYMFTAGDDNGGNGGTNPPPTPPAPKPLRVTTVLTDSSKTTTNSQR